MHRPLSLRATLEQAIGPAPNLGETCAFLGGCASLFLDGRCAPKYAMHLRSATLPLPLFSTFALAFAVGTAACNKAPAEPTKSEQAPASAPQAPSAAPEAPK